MPQTTYGTTVEQVFTPLLLVLWKFHMFIAASSSAHESVIHNWTRRLQCVYFLKRKVVGRLKIMALRKFLFLLFVSLFDN